MVTDKKTPLVTEDPLKSEFPSDVDELKLLLKTMFLLWRKKNWILLGAFLITAAGVIYALISEPVYTAQAIIAPKEADKGISAGGLLSQMGGLGGMMAAQMGVGGTKLDYIAIIAKSHDLAEVIIHKYNLLPHLFHKKYNFDNSQWIVEKDSTEIPGISNGVVKFTKDVISVSTDIKRNVVIIKAEMHDSLLVAEVINYCIVELDKKLKYDMVKQSQEKKAFLDSQMKTTADPWMIQKLQALSVLEVEKAMMVAGKSIEVLETPMVPLKKTKPERVKIVVIAFIGGCILSMMILLIVNKFNELLRTEN